MRILSLDPMGNNSLSKYPSKYSNGKSVSGAQYITEIVCENKAKREKKDLHFRFWTEPYWEKFFRNQIASANILIKSYDPIDIAKALKTINGQKIFSLRAPHLKKIIETEEQKRKNLNNKPIKKIERKENIIVKQHQPNKNILDLLEE
jgi:hypothetical protein